MVLEDFGLQNLECFRDGSVQRQTLLLYHENDTGWANICTSSVNVSR
jgi:hypothetical protein